MCRAAAYRSSFTSAGSAAAPESGPDTPHRHLHVLIIIQTQKDTPHRYLHVLIIIQAHTDTNRHLQVPVTIQTHTDTPHRHLHVLIITQTHEDTQRHLRDTPHRQLLIILIIILSPSAAISFDPLSLNQNLSARHQFVAVILYIFSQSS